VLLIVRAAGRPALAASAALVACLLGSRVAGADITKDQCVEDNAKAQDLVRDGHLLAAGDQLRACAVPACPALIRNDCTQRLDEVLRAQPSFVFDVKDASGMDLIDVHVSMDGQLLTDHLDGKPLKVDPGVHTFTFEVASRAPINRRLLVKQGEAARVERVVFKGLLSPPPAPAVAPVPLVVVPPVKIPEPQPAEASSGLGGQRVAGLVVGIAGVVGLGVGGTFGILASSAWSSAKSQCGGTPTSCLPAGVTAATSDHSTAVTDATVSTVALAAGGALVVGGVILFLTGGHHGDGPTSAFTLAPDLGRGQAGAILQGVF
jgi:hypothetical protein